MISGLRALLHPSLLPRKAPGGPGRTDSENSLKEATSAASMGKGSHRGDSLRLSQPVQLLKEAGLCLEGSAFHLESQALAFHLEFEDQQIRGLTSSGTYDIHSRSLKVDFSFRSALLTRDPVTGEEHQELFQFDFHMEAHDVRSNSGGLRMEKEDILTFARKILNRINELHSEGKTIDGLVLDEEDLRELGAVEDGRLLEAIMHIVELLGQIDRLRKEKEESVWLHPERTKATASGEEHYESQSLSLELSVQRIAMESLPAQEPVAGTAGGAGAV